MGDDLIFAQKFTRTAADGLALLVEMEDPRATQDSAVVIDMMTTVQRGAKRLRARHIYSGAQGVLSALHHETDTILQGRIENLGYLVTEYARGLSELIPNSEETTPKTRRETWDMARETLDNLLPMASAEDADLLSRIMRAPVTLETVQPKQEDSKFVKSEVVVFPTAEMPVVIENSEIKDLEIEGLEIEDLTIEDIDIESPIIEDMLIENPAPRSQQDSFPPQPVTQQPVTGAPSPEVPLESMMRDVIADALSVARSVGRTISLSYDMGNKTISAAQSENLRERLGRALSQIIQQSLTEERVGHIDINQAGEQLHIIAGTTAMRVAIAPTANAKPAAQPLITDKTEQGLRSQLNALMDPQSLHETAS